MKKEKIEKGERIEHNLDASELVTTINMETVITVEEMLKKGYSKAQIARLQMEDL